jgi:DNA-binding MarR family transcriptional regulator
MSDGHDLAMALRAAYLTLHRRANAIFANQGVTADQFVLLTLLAAEDGVTQQDLVRRSSSDPNTVGAMLTLLERQGLVARSPHAHDRRARCVELTAEGRAAQRRLWEASQPFREDLSAAVPEAQQPLLLDLLRRLTRTLAPPRRTTSGRLSAET